MKPFLVICDTRCLEETKTKEHFRKFPRSARRLKNEKQIQAISHANTHFKRFNEFPTIIVFNKFCHHFLSQRKQANIFASKAPRGSVYLESALIRDCLHFSLELIMKMKRTCWLLTLNLASSWELSHSSDILDWSLRERIIQWKRKHVVQWIFFAQKKVPGLGKWENETRKMLLADLWGGFHEKLLIDSAYATRAWTLLLFYLFSCSKVRKTTESFVWRTLMTSFSILLSSLETMT